MEAERSKENPKSELASSDTADLNEALDRIFEYYGADLDAFFRDAYKETALKCYEPDRDEF